MFSGTVLSTYPQRVVVPYVMSDEDIEECSKYRTKERFPILSYYNKLNGASIWRSSQPKGGLFGKVNRGDQKIMRSIIYTLPKSSKIVNNFATVGYNEAMLHIYDARSQIAAIGNKVFFKNKYRSNR